MASRISRFVALACVAAAISGFAPVARAASEADNWSGKNNGAYSTTIPISVPAYHGVEPKLALQYNSGSGNGYVGVGWSLGGMSRIEPFGPGHAATESSTPTTFFLDGQELVPCAAGSTSPSCTTGASWTGSSNGFFSTKTESYVRIQHVVGSMANSLLDDVWYVWQKNGTRIKYTRIAANGGVASRWVIAEVRDTQGNTVTYNWATYAATDRNSSSGCWSYARNLVRPQSISYNGVTIQFYWGTRPDQEEVAMAGSAPCDPGTVTVLNGTECTTTSTACAWISSPGTCSGGPGTCGVRMEDFGGETLLQRLTAIDVMVSGSRARVYELTYTGAGGSTGRSLLSQVQMFGTDATLDATGAVTNAATASSLPPFTLGWPQAARGNGFSALPENPMIGGWLTSSGQVSMNPHIYPAQFTGNGKADYLVFRDGNNVGGTIISPRYYKCIGGLTFNNDGTNCPGWDVPNGLPGRIVSADFNGDGLTDFLLFDEASGSYQKWYTDPANPTGDFIKFTGTFNAPPTSSPSNNHADWENLTRTVAADFNGDTYTDILFYNRTNGYYEKWYSHDATMNGSFDRQAAGQWQSGFQLTAVDLDGDHRTDIVAFNPGNILQYPNPVPAVFLVERSDPVTSVETPGFVEYNYPAPNYAVNSNYSPAPMVYEDYYGGFMATDLNGDGYQDLIFYSPSTGILQKWYSAGLSTEGFVIEPFLTIESAAQDQNHNGPTLVTGDFNADGKTDLLLYQPYSGYTAKWYGSGTVTADFDRQPSFTATRDDGSTLKNAQVFAVDVNGDTRTDAVFSYFVPFASGGPLANSWAYKPLLSDVDANTPTPDLLLGIANGTGGTTTVAYTPSNTFISNPSINGQIVLQAATSITESDGRGGSYTSTIQYFEPFYDQGKRLFEGFRRVTFTKPNGAYMDVYYHQRYGDGGQVRAAYQKDSAGNVYSYECIHYADAAASCQTDPTNTGQLTPSGASYTSLPDQYWKWVCDGAGTCKRTARILTYDAYANITYEVRTGDYDGSGDESQHVAMFTPNVAAYIVNKPYYSYVTDTATLGYVSHLLAATRVFYDSSTSLGAPPTAGNATQDCNWLSTTNTYLCTTATYDAYGNVVGTTDARNNSASQIWDPTYHTVKVSTTNALHQTSTVDAFDPRCGVSTHETDINGQPLAFTYDALCRRTSVTHADGSAETTSYSSFGDPNAQYVSTTRTDGTSEGLWTNTFFDGMGRTYQTQTRGLPGLVNYGPKPLGPKPLPTSPPRPISVTWQYDAYGRLAAKSNPFSPGETPVYTQMQYDAINRLTQVTNPVTGVTTMNYGVQSGVACVAVSGSQTDCYMDWTETVDPVGQRTRTVRDARGNNVAVGQWDTSSGTFDYTYYGFDLMGQLLKVQDADGNVASHAFDSLGRRVVTQDPDAGLMRYSYDENGNLRSQTDAKNQTIGYQYDAANRLTVKSYCTDATCVSNSGTVTNYYDEGAGVAWPSGNGFSLGHRTRQVDSRSGVVKQWSYDRVGRVENEQSTIDGTQYPFHYAYDVAGRMNQLVYPDGEVVTTTYDTTGRPASLGGNSPYVSAAQYTSGSQLQSLSGLGISTSFQYDALGAMTSEVSTWSGGTLQQLAYVNFPNGQIQSSTDSLHGYDTFFFRYDSFGRLVNSQHGTPATPDHLEWTRAMTYSPAGRILSKTGAEGSGVYAYPTQGVGAVRPHAPTQVGSYSDFTYDANGNMLTGASRTFSYDENNLPVAITSAAGTETFTYDGEGHRVKRVEGDGSTTIDVSPFYQITGGVATKYYVFDGKMVARVVGTGAPDRVLCDRQGGVQKIVASDGTVTRHQMFLPFGEAVYFNSATAEAHEYTGHLKDPSGLLFMQARYYDPIIGQFTSPDSIRQLGPQQLNPYAYALNDPVNRIDPTGHFAILPAIAAAIISYITADVVSAFADHFLGERFGSLVTALVMVGSLDPAGLVRGGFALAEWGADEAGWRPLSQALSIAEAATVGAMRGGLREAAVSAAGSAAGNAASDVANTGGLAGSIVNHVASEMASSGVDLVLAKPVPLPPPVKDIPDPPQPTKGAKATDAAAGQDSPGLAPSNYTTISGDTQNGNQIIHWQAEVRTGYDGVADAPVNDSGGLDTAGEPVTVHGYVTLAPETGIDPEAWGRAAEIVTAIMNFPPQLPGNDNPDNPGAPERRAQETEKEVMPRAIPPVQGGPP